MKYRKKPVVISAHQWDGKSYYLLLEELDVNEELIHLEGSLLRILTLEGVMTAAPGDYIIKGVEGEVYPCKESVFIASYDEA